MSGISSLQAERDSWVRPLFGAGVVAVEAVPALVDEQLYPEELACIASAVTKRRAEFGTARVCARKALAQLGVLPTSLAPNADRSPTWPPGVVGTITHTRGYCAVAVAPVSVARSLGLDAEEDRALDDGVLKMICTPGERERLAHGPNGVRDAVVYFAAKEAFYKCQYPITRTFLDFQDVALEVQWEVGTFRMTAVRGFEWLEGQEGRFQRRQGLVSCGVEIRASTSPQES